MLRSQHAAWRLLRADSSPLVLSFLGQFFVEENRGATPASELAAALEDELHALSSTGPDTPLYPRRAADYLQEWAATGAGWLRRFYQTGSDEIHYDATPALEKAYAWVTGLRSRSFVGTESRLQMAVELLRQIVRGVEQDPQVRLEELLRQRAAIDAQIEEVEAGDLPLLDPTGLRDRYQQFSGTARGLLADFREVEENFRSLDRAARERIASWEGSKGELLAELTGSREDINTSDQGRSFQAFHDLLLSETRQEELSDLLQRVQSLEEIERDPRLGTVHHDWADAAERTQQTVRQISEQLRRFLDDQVWFENRRVLEIVRAIEASALACRADPPNIGLEVDRPGVPISLPLERPLYDPRPAAEVDSLLDPEADADVDVAALFTQSFVDPTRLAEQIRAAVPARGSVLLSDLVQVHPLEQGAAEIVGYLALAEDDIEVEMDESEETVLEYEDAGVSGEDPVVRRARLPQVRVSRR